jgi:hypothetical protein
MIGEEGASADGVSLCCPQLVDQAPQFAAQVIGFGADLPATS